MYRLANLRNAALIFVVATFSLVLLTSMALQSPQVAAQTSQDSEAADRIAKNKQYLREADVLFGQKFAEEKKIMDNEKAKESTTSEQERQILDQKIAESKQKMEQIQQQIDALEKLNQALFAMDPALERKIYSTQKHLIDKYVIKDSGSYIGENPVEAVEAELLTRSITISVNPDKVAPDGSNLPTESNIEGIPVQIKYSKLELVGCTPYSNTGVCRPVIGGVSTSEQNTLTPNTIGYKATWNGFVGFVTAGHTAQGVGKALVQPHNDATKRVGAVPSGAPTAICQSGLTCDFAFVKADSGISVDDDLFITPSNSLWDINLKRADSGQTVGTLVAKSGVGSSYTSGQIVENNPSLNYNRASFNAVGGDSGSPVFRSSGTATAELFGMVFAINGSNNTYYFPQDLIQTVIGATASTT